jgi:adenine-specific DNA-methyltransferase
MSSLLADFAGKVDLIYIDPPFATGADFSFEARIGDDLEVMKEQTILEEKAYRDTWGSGLMSWLQMMDSRLPIARDLLSERGAIYVHCDYRVASHLRLLLDEIFGADHFQNQIVWHYSGWNRHGEKYFNRRHDLILYYSRGSRPAFNSYSIPWASKEEYVRLRKQKINVDASGREYVLSDAGEGRRVKRYLEEAMAFGKPADDVWNLDKINNSSKEAVGYPTQKPEALLERIVTASSPHGGLVADFFCGSGTTAAIAEKLGRRWIACDLGRWGVHVTRKRLLEIPGCNPFEVLNLGMYECQFWQGTAFGADDAGGRVSERALYEYLAFVLKLYGAQPVAGLANLHGKKGSALVHVGAVDAPVTVDEISDALEECAALRQSELHVLGWEWEMGLAGPNNDYHHGGLMQEEAKRHGIKLLLLQIPREVMEQQAVDRGDVKFFELAYLDAKVQWLSGLQVAVSLRDFVIPNTDLMPEEMRDRVTKWSNYIDYWAVDWDFRNDSFMQGWVAYRTRRDRSLPLESDEHTYEEPGIYRVAVKVIDIFGNDTTQAYTVEVE